MFRLPCIQRIVVGQWKYVNKLIGQWEDDGKRLCVCLWRDKPMTMIEAVSDFRVSPLTANAIVRDKTTPRHRPTAGKLTCILYA